MVHLIFGISTFLMLIGRNKKMLYISFGILFVFAALRYDYGNDYASYLKWFKYIRGGGESPFGKQILFTYLNEISPSFSFLIAVTSAFFLLAIFILIKKNVSSDYVAISFLIFVINPYLFLMNLSALRQSIATAIFIFAITFAKNKKIIPYCILIIIAMLFHKSAILLLPIYFIANESEIKKSHIAVILAVTAILVFTPDTISKLIESALDYFKDNTYTSYYEAQVTNSLRATLLSSVYFLYIILNIRKLRGNVLVYTKLYMLGMFFSILAFRLSMFTRIQMYFDVFSVVSLPGIIECNIKYNKDKISYMINVFAFPALILVIYILRYYSFFNNPLWEAFVEYKTVIGVAI